jgi:hypothetical protein
MKRKISLILLCVALLLPFAVFATGDRSVKRPPLREESDKNDKNEWYPFVIPEKLDADSPANIGKLVLDAPAGNSLTIKPEVVNPVFSWVF